MYLTTHKIRPRWKHKFEQRSDGISFYFRTWLKASANDPPDLTINISNWRICKRPRPQEIKPADVEAWSTEAFKAVTRVISTQNKQNRPPGTANSRSDESPFELDLSPAVAASMPIMRIVLKLIEHDQCPYDVELERWPDCRPPRSYLQLFDEDGRDVGHCVCSADGNHLWMACVTRRQVLRSEKTGAPRGVRCKTKVWDKKDQIKADYKRMKAERPKKYSIDIIGTLSKDNNTSLSSIKRILRS